MQFIDLAKQQSFITDCIIFRPMYPYFEETKQDKILENFLYAVA